MTLLCATNALSCTVILFGAVFRVINRMDAKTNHYIRMAWVLAATGAFGALASIAYGHPNGSLPDMVLHTGAAIAMLFDRRRRTQNRPQPPSAI
jgi:hypothetical protein